MSEAIELDRPAVARPVRVPSRWRISDAALGVMLIMPSLLLFLLLIVYPIAQAFVLSAQNVHMLTLTGEYVGLKNYQDVLGRNEFWVSFANTAIWTVGSLVGQVVVGILFALLLNSAFSGHSLARGVILLPYLLSTVVTVLIWQWMLNDLYGVVDFALMDWGITNQPIHWLTRMPNAMIMAIVVATWKYFPFVVITILARLQSIPPQLYEAARIDGAGPVARFFDITLPQIRSVLLLILLLRGIWDLKDFDLIFLLTQGGPQIGTQTLPLLIYKEAFGQLHLGRGAAVAILMLGIMVIMFALYIWRFRREARENAS